MRTGDREGRPSIVIGFHHWLFKPITTTKYAENDCKNQYENEPVGTSLVGVLNDDDKTIVNGCNDDDNIIKTGHINYGESDETLFNMDIAASERAPASDAPPLSLGSIIGSFKSRCVVDNLKYIEDNGLNETGKIWQRNYHDQIIRNENDLYRFRKYIRDNPKNWVNDENNPDSIMSRSVPRIGSRNSASSKKTK